MKTWLWIVCVVSIIGLCVFFSVYISVTEVKYEKEFEVYAGEFKVDKNLLKAVAKVESGFRENAKSSAGAVGVMQLMPSTAKWVASELGDSYSEEKLFNANTNIRYGAFFLSYLLGKYEDLVYVLACYNAGEGVVSSWGEPGTFTADDVPYGETKNFIKKVLSYYEVYKM